MEKYLGAAERIAVARHRRRPAARSRSRSSIPRSRTRRIRRVDASTIEATHRVDFDGEYIVRFGLPGERAADAKPVHARLLDGRQAAPQR